MTPPASPALAARIEDLYEVFGKYPLRRHVEGCPCGCIPPEAQANLHHRPLRQMEPDDLSRYAFKAMTTWGDVNDFKHFLPRLLELLVHRGFVVDTEIVLGKLRYGHWEAWPAQEQEAVSSFLNAWWVAVLSEIDDDFPREVDDLLTGIAQAEQELTPYLEQWDALQTAAAAYHLAAFVVFNAEELVRGELTNAFWADRPDQGRQVLTWLRTERQQRRLQGASTVFRASPLAEVLEQAAFTLSVARG